MPTCSAALIAALVALPDVPIRASSYAELRQALTHAKPGTTVLLEPGEYAGGFQIENISGKPGQPIVIAGRDPKNPPRIVRGGLHFVSVAHLELRDLRIDGVVGNALNTDDGGVREKPAHHVTYRRITVTDCLAPGSVALKMAGVDDFAIEDCEVRGYDTCAVDFVGCHDGVVARCRFERGTGVGVQAKGASRNVRVLDCRFKDYGARGVNLAAARDPILPASDRDPGGGFALRGEGRRGRRVHVRGATPRSPSSTWTGRRSTTTRSTCRSVGRSASCRETAAPDFLPARSGAFTDNLVVFRSDRWFEAASTSARAPPADLHVRGQPLVVRRPAEEERPDAADAWAQRRRRA
jgi:hypothetical protein